MCNRSAYLLYRFTLTIYIPVSDAFSICGIQKWQMTTTTAQEKKAEIQKEV